MKGLLLGGRTAWRPYYLKTTLLRGRKVHTAWVHQASREVCLAPVSASQRQARASSDSGTTVNTTYEAPHAGMVTGTLLPIFLREGTGIGAAILIGVETDKEGDICGLESDTEGDI